MDCICTMQGINGIANWLTGRKIFEITEEQVGSPAIDDRSHLKHRCGSPRCRHVA
jgi:hypothetical protein